LRNPPNNSNPRWAGSTVVCVASGPSLVPADVEFVRGKAGKVIVVNASFNMVPWADVLYAADFRFWNVYINEIRAVFKGECWTLSAQAGKMYGLSCIGLYRGDGYSIIPNTISSGGNSGYQAVHLAAYWGASRIILLGYDMQRTGGKEHWHGKHKGKLPNGRGFPLWIRRFNILVRDIKKRGIEIVNCTRKTALVSVPCTPLEEIVW
jgi:hypothetical protein